MNEMKSKSLVSTMGLSPERVGSTQCVKKAELITKLNNFHSKGLLLE